MSMQIQAGRTYKAFGPQISEETEYYLKTCETISGYIYVFDSTINKYACE